MALGKGVELWYCRSLEVTVWVIIVLYEKSAGGAPEMAARVTRCAVL